MSDAFHKATVQQMGGMLTALAKILDKVEQHCEAKKIDPSVLLNARLFPDMFDFKRQVQMTADFAKGAAGRLSGQEPPAFADTETTIPELKGRIAKTIDYLKTIGPAEFAGAMTREITIAPGGNKMTFSGEDFANRFSLPNFYFHMTSAYAILRKNGVEVGKWDFMGRA
ncbi:MAG TPA: DUF1993 domain-containing protein [Alphaproteobacteria bacterium]|nr:DUF1993 domain-containing protein [Alphaproteobacteria bacterium]HAJ47356.1 DUF1993 domain-containing protein [Alphaproteobacteria bacterium]